MQDLILNNVVIGDGHSLSIFLVDTIHREYDEVRSWGSQFVLLLLVGWDLSDHHLQVDKFTLFYTIGQNSHG